MSAGLRATSVFECGLPGIHPAAEGERIPSPPRATQASDELGTAAIEAAVTDLERVLGRDRSHAVLAAAPGPRQARVLDALAARLQNAFEVVSLAGEPGLEEDEILERILAELGLERKAAADLQLLGVIGQLAREESALVLLISDANRMPAGTLRRLGRLSSRARLGLRLGLVAASEPSAEEDAVAELVASLGVGAAKVVLDEVGTRPETSVFAHPPPIVVPPAAGAENAPPPVLRPEESPLAETPHSAPRWWRRPRWPAVALGAAAACIGIHALAVPAAPPEVTPRRELEAVAQGDPTQSETPEALEIDVAKPPAAAALRPELEPLAQRSPTRPEKPAGMESERAATPAPVIPQPQRELVAESEPMHSRRSEVTPSEGPATPAAGTRSSEPEPLAQHAPIRPEEPDAPLTERPRPVSAIGTREETSQDAPRSRGALEPSAAAVAVSLNSRPWARIEVDGRSVGITPLADLPMPAGPHRFRAHLADGRVVERSVRVDAHRNHISFP